MMMLMTISSIMITIVIICQVGDLTRKLKSEMQYIIDEQVRRAERHSHCLKEFAMAGKRTRCLFDCERPHSCILRPHSCILTLYLRRSTCVLASARTGTQQVGRCSCCCCRRRRFNRFRYQLFICALQKAPTLGFFGSVCWKC